MGMMHKIPTQVTPSLTLSQLANKMAEKGTKAIRSLFGSGPVFVIRPKKKGKAEDEVLFNTPPHGTPLPDTSKWSEPKGMSETRSDEFMPPWAGMADGDSLIVPIAKSDRNPWMGLITVGRALNNDMRLTSPRVSKLQAFIKETADGWKVQDSNSSNGTFLNHMQLEPKVDFLVRSGDEIRFGDVSGLFLDIDGLQALCWIVSRRKSA